MGDTATVPFADAEKRSARTLIDLALREDLADGIDVTSHALIPESFHARVQVAARDAGVVCGGPIAELVFETLDADVQWTTRIPDGADVQPGDIVAEVGGPMRSLLTGERTALNFLTHLSGVATLTRRFVNAVGESKAKILDTRKTHPGYRVLEKYAVRCGGGTNHRMGLYDGCLIKDNHVAALGRILGTIPVAAAVETVQAKIATGLPLEIEVDTLEQLKAVLPSKPEIVLLDNMPPADLSAAVALRDRHAPEVLLEASGGVTLETVAEIAATGVDRISIGALTHSAVALDLAFDWQG